MTRILAILTLISGCILEEFAAECTSHNLIELLHDEFVAVYFVHFFFALADCALPTETAFKGTFPAGFLD